MVLTGISVVVGQSKPSSQTSHKEPVYVAANNGKVISSDGSSLLSETDFLSIRVRHDTVFFTLKDDALKRLDADPAKNYKQEKKQASSKRK